MLCSIRLILLFTVNMVFHLPFIRFAFVTINIQKNMMKRLPRIYKNG